MTLDEAIQEFEFDCKIRHRSRKTIDNYHPIHVLASRAKVVLLRSGKQCIWVTKCKMLVEGSAPKPLKTSTKVLWLWSDVAISP